MSPTPPLTPAERFAQIIAMMVAMLGARLERPGKPGLAGLLTYAIYIRLQRIRNRLTRYVARFQAGTLTPPRRRTRPAAAHRRSIPAKPLVELPKLPRARMWLVRLVPGIGVGANHLRILLEDPEMAAMLAAAPQIGRTLRPFWHMLSPDPLPPLLQPPSPAPAPPPGAPPRLSPLPISGEGGERSEPGEGAPGRRDARPRGPSPNPPPAPEVVRRAWVSPALKPA